LRSVTAFNGYPISFVLAVLLHVMVVVALFLFQRSNTEAIQVVQPPAIRANLVGMNPQARNQQAQEQREAERAREQRQAQQRREEEQRQAAARQEQQRQEQQRAEQERQAELQRIAQVQERQEREQQQQRQDQQRRQEQERQASEQRQREEQQRQEQQRQEQQRQQEVAAQQERERQQRAQQEAAAQAQATAAAAQEGEAVMSYTTLIHDLVQQQWSRPPSARNGMVTVLRIRLVPTGEVIDVEVVQSSGDGAFDRAAVTAVNRVGTIRELQGMDPQLFNRNFRTLLLTFRPEDLLN